MHETRVRKHFFVVENESTKEKFRVKLKETYEYRWRCTSFDMQIIEGKSFIPEDYLFTLLGEIALMYSGIGKMTEPVGRDEIVFHFDIAR